MRNAYIIDGSRSAIGNFKGTLSALRTDNLLAEVIKNLIKKHPNLPLHNIDDVIIGCANQAGEDNRNIARMSALLAGLPINVPGETINRLCASGMSSVIQAYRAIKSNEGDLFIAGGVEGMSRSPYVLSKAEGNFDTQQKMYDSSFGWRFINPLMEKMYGTEAMGKTAENLAELYNISRDEQDEYAFQSQQKASKAQLSGRFSKEIGDLNIPLRKSETQIFNIDEFIKPHTSIEKLSTLKPAFKSDGSVTAGNSSGLNDGAAAVIVASDNAVEQYQFQPLTRILSSAVVGVEPRIMGIGPVPASELALKRAGLTLDDIDIIEINEAFAAQSIACLKALHIDWKNDQRINPNGGAIALGHPLGMSGTRILHSASIELQEQNKKYALVTMCIGVGQGYAVILENPNV